MTNQMENIDMKRASIALTSLLLMVSCSQINAGVQDIGRHSAYPETVARARDLPNNTWVTLTGKIIRNIGDSLYLFQDSTDEIRVAIAQKAWNGVSFNPEVKVRITGKVDLNFQGIQINVDQVELLVE